MASGPGPGRPGVSGPGTEVAPAEEEEQALEELAAQVSGEARPPERQLRFIDTSIYSKVLAGRAKGALPILFDIPARGEEYVFVKEFTGTASPEVRLRFVRSTGTRAAALLVAVLVAAAAAAGLKLRKKYSPQRPSLDPEGSGPEGQSTQR